MGIRHPRRKHTPSIINPQYSADPQYVEGFSSPHPSEKILRSEINKKISSGCNSSAGHFPLWNAFWIKFHIQMFSEAKKTNINEAQERCKIQRKNKIRGKGKKMNRVEIGQVNEENGTKRLIGEDVAKRMKESDGLSGEEREKIAVGIDMAGRSQKISVS